MLRNTNILVSDKVIGETKEIEAAFKLSMFAKDKLILKFAYSLGMDSCQVQKASKPAKDGSDLYEVTRQFAYQVSEKLDEVSKGE